MSVRIRTYSVGFDILNRHYTFDYSRTDRQGVIHMYSKVLGTPQSAYRALKNLRHAGLSKDDFIGALTRIAEIELGLTRPKLINGRLHFVVPEVK